LKNGKFSLHLFLITFKRFQINSNWLAQSILRSTPIHLHVSLDPPTKVPKVAFPRRPPDPMYQTSEHGSETCGDTIGHLYFHVRPIVYKIFDKNQTSNLLTSHRLYMGTQLRTLGPFFRRYGCRITKQTTHGYSGPQDQSIDTQKSNIADGPKMASKYQSSKSQNFFRQLCSISPPHYNEPFFINIPPQFLFLEW